VTQFARANGYDLADSYYDAAVSGADPIDERNPCRSKLARNLRRTIARAFLNLASSKTGLMLFRQTWIGLGKSAAGNVGRRGASPKSDPISQSCVADVRGLE
jgi:hypothetical protein